MNPKQPMLTVRLMQNLDARRVAQLHAESIAQGFLVRLGRRFLEELYRGIAEDAGSSVFVAVDEGRVLGFCAYSRDVSAMYRRVLRSRFFRLGLASLPYSLNPLVLKEVTETLRYSGKQRARALPPAEILSIGVDAIARGKGVGRALIDVALERLRADGERQIKVLAGVGLDAANAFYRAYGFRPAGELVQHGGVLNVYVCDMGSQA